MADKPQYDFSGVSVITEGVAQGHNLLIDATTLEQVASFGKANAPIKVLADHSDSVGEIIGYMDNFTIDSKEAGKSKVRADFHILETSEKANFFSELISKLAEQIGFSISFEADQEQVDGGMFARLKQLFSIDLVVSPATNAGVFSIKSGNGSETATTQVFDIAKNSMNKEEITAFVNEAIKPLVEKLSMIEASLAQFAKTDAVAGLSAELGAIKVQFEDAKGKVEVIAEPEPEVSVVEKFSRLNGAERTKFWKENRTELSPFIKTK